MAEDWAIDVRRYAPDADDAVIAGIVRHCGIALRSRDASLVSFTDREETDRVRESFCKKKLGLTDPDEVLDAAIANVGERMKADHTKNRVTVYYLLAEHFGMLALFGGAAAAAAAAEPVEADPEPDPLPEPEPLPPVLPVATLSPPPPPMPPVPPAPAVASVMAAPAMAAPATAAVHPAAAKPSEPEDVVTSTGLIALGVVAAGILAAALGGLILTGTTEQPTTPPAAPILPAGASTTGAPGSGPPLSLFAPSGAAAVAQEVDGKPMVSVYFITASAVVVPDFAAAAAPIKAWLDTHPGDRLAVSGYNDPRGDAAFNAELSKNRAENVAAALAALGIAPGAIDLEKPAETTDLSTDYEHARRVDIMVKEAGG